jgi:hypothetical protein
VAAFAAVSAASALAGATVATSSPKVALALALLVAASLFLFAPTEVFVAGSLLATGVLALLAKFSVSAGPAVVYGGDMFLMLVFARALLPKRRTPGHRFAAATVFATAVFFSLMAFGLLRAVTSGHPVDSAVREGLALFYWPILAFSFSRILREEGIDLALVLRWCVGVVVCLIVYMLLMRGLNRPFESPDVTGGSLGGVPGSDGQVFRRDFGFASAFILYPVLALLAMSVLTYARRNVRLWFALLAFGVGATALTLIRSEIYGLMGGAAILLLVSRNQLSSRRFLNRANRARVLVSLTTALVFVSVLVTIANPGLAGVIGKRAIPDFGSQSAGAQANAEYRLEALQSGIRVANRNPLGLGFVSPDELRAAGADPNFLVHSAPGAVLSYLGWSGLLAGAFLVGALFVESARAHARAPWLHPFFVGTFTMLVLYGFGAVGLVGQDFVISVAALVLAARFATTATPDRA